MAQVISVKFKDTGKDYYFDPNGVTAERGQNVIVETSKGYEFALCSRGNHEVPDDSIVPPLRPVIRVATAEDAKIDEENHIREREALALCREKAAKHNLDMKLIDAEYSFDGSKLLFFFTSEGRVDFRDLVKELAGVFHTRIELRQIGVRDEARLLGGLGICGRPFCCANFLDDFQPVSIKMAKTQGLSLNPAKISGTCGRLMCCLKYEQDAYEELVKNVPKVDAFVDTPAGKGSVVDVDLLRGTVRVKLEDQIAVTIKTFNANEVEVLGGKAKRAEYVAARALEKSVADKEAEAKRTVSKVRRTVENKAEFEQKSQNKQQTIDRPDVPQNKTSRSLDSSQQSTPHQQGNQPNKTHRQKAHAQKTQSTDQTPMKSKSTASDRNDFSSAPSPEQNKGKTRSHSHRRKNYSNKQSKAEQSNK